MGGSSEQFSSKAYIHLVASGPCVNFLINIPVSWFGQTN